MVMEKAASTTVVLLTMPEYNTGGKEKQETSLQVKTNNNMVSRDEKG